MNATATLPVIDTSPDESEIRQLMNEWRDALCAKDADRMVAHYAPDVLLFEVTPPYQHKGPETYRANWQACFPYLPPSLGSEIREMVVTVKGDLAFAHGLHRLVDKATEKPPPAAGSASPFAFNAAMAGGRWCMSMLQSHLIP